MADIKDEMQAIEAAYKGKEIKDAIVSALDKVNTNEGTARFLDGHGPSEFLSQEELNSILPLDNEPMPDSGKAISSGKIYSYLDKMGKAVDDVNGSYNSSSSSESIKDKLEYLNETKRAIRKELIDKGIEVDPDRDSFRSYAEKIGQIEMESNLAVEPLEITENGTYEAEEGYAYNPVIANVAFDLVPKTITKNGTYKAENEGHDGYSEVDVTASSALITKTVAGSDFPDEIETLEFKAADEGGDAIGYTQVDIDVSDKIEETKTIILEHDATGEELVYNASDDHVYGYGKVEILLHDTSQFFTVKFMSDGEVVYEEDHVEKGSSCSYKGRTLEKEGYVFSGWNPQPINIERNLICVAKWVEDEKAQKDAGGGGGGGTSIGNMTWKDVQAHPEYINTGDTKLIYWMPFEWNGHQFRGGQAIAKCIYKGEPGTNSTWCFNFNFGNVIDNIDVSSAEDLYISVLTMGDEHGGTQLPMSFDYNKNPFYSLCSTLADKILECKGDGYDSQNDLQFKPVLKVTTVIENGNSKVKQDTLNGLWLFSGYEFAGTGWEGKPSGAIHYPEFIFGLTEVPINRSAWNYQQIKVTTDYEAEHSGLSKGTIMAQEAQFIGMPGGYLSWDSYVGAYCNKNEWWYNNHVGSWYRGLYETISTSRVGRGGPMPNLYFGFCL